MGGQFSISDLLNLRSESVGAYNFEIIADDSYTGGPSSFTVRMEYLFAFQFWYCKLCVENPWWGEGGWQKALFCEFLFFGVALLAGGWRVVGYGRKFYLGPTQISSFSNRNFRQRNRHDLFWLVLSNEYFYILFLWVILISDFLPLEIHKYLVLPLSSITFTANSQADNHFYKCIYLFQKQSSRGVL